MTSTNELIKANPYRTLGVFVNSPAKDRVANKSKMKAFLKVGKAVDFPADMTALIGTAERTEETVADAESKLTLPAEQIKHAQFWFINSTALDDAAFRNLETGDMETALGIWAKRECASSLQNRVVCMLINGDIASACIAAQRLYSAYATDFVAAVDATAAVPSESELAKSFITSLCEVVGAQTVLGACKSNSEWSGIAGDMCAGPVIEALKDIFAQVQSSTKQKKLVSKSLIANAKSQLKALAKLTGSADSRYTQWADKIGLEILQCSINYCNASDDPYSVADIEEHVEAASEIVVSQFAKDRCEENLRIVRHNLAGLPPKQVKEAADALTLKLNKPFLGNTSSISSFLSDCNSLLEKISEDLDKQNSLYVGLSTHVAMKALYASVDIANNAQRENNTPIELLDIIDSVYDIMLTIRGMTLDPKFRKNAFEKNFKTLTSIRSRLQNETANSPVYPSESPLHSVQSSSTAGKLVTLAEVDKILEEAQRRKAEIEREKAEKRSDTIMGCSGYLFLGGCFLLFIGVYNGEPKLICAAVISFIVWRILYAIFN